MNYGYYNQNFVDNLLRQKDKIEGMLSQINQPPAPVQNIINTNGVDFEAKELSGVEDVNNILVQRRTLFIDENNKKIYIKELNGDISKTYDIIIPKDEKDLKIEELENKLRMLEEKVNVECTKFDGTNDEVKQSVANDDRNVESATKNFFKSVSKQK